MIEDATNQVRPSDADRLFDYIEKKGVEFDTVFSYEEVHQIVPKSRNVIQSLVRRLNRRLGRTHHRYLKNIPTQGWRVVRPEEHVELGHEHVDRASRQVGKAVQIVAHADATAMSPMQRDRNDITLSGLRALQRQVKENAIRLKRLEGVQTTQAQVLSQHDARISDIQRQIDELKRTG